MVFDLNGERQRRTFEEIKRRREKALSIYRQFPDGVLLQMIALAVEVLMERRIASAMDKHDQTEKGRYI